MRTGCPVQKGTPVPCVIRGVDPNSVAPGITLKDLDEFALYDSATRVVYAIANVDGPDIATGDNGNQYNASSGIGDNSGSM